jgi:serine/threonine-protein kinase CHEK1
MPHLTRFWASIPPPELITVIERALERQSIRTVRPVDGPNGELRCRIGAFDARRVPFKGWAIVEPFVSGSARSFCVMQRDEVTNSFPLTLCMHIYGARRTG